MNRNCSECSASFEVTAEDLSFYDKVSPVFDGRKYSIPAPHNCPNCRHRHRMAFRNERHLYRRKCDATKHRTLSLYEEGTSFPVYSHEAWWSEDWDALSYGIDYDSNTSFFVQFRELIQKVPRLGIVTGHNENCDYCNYVNYSKDSYLCFGCHSAENCYHNWRVHWCEHCIDCLQMDKSKWCYECIDCDGCYNLRFSQDCTTCHDSDFLYDCKNCSNSIMCAGLRNTEYCILNMKLDREEFEKKKMELSLTSSPGIEKCRKQFAEFLLTQPHRNLFILNAQHAQGDHIRDSQNLFECYHVRHAEDCRYLESCEEIKDSMDNTFSGWPAELIFQTMSAGVQCYNFLFCTACWSCSNLLYCDSCHHSSDLFGCVGLKNKNKYCVLNKQYSKDEYEKLVSRILSDMSERKEWGEFFPKNISPYAYNETVANEFYPLSKAEALSQGFAWKELRDEVPNVTRSIPAIKLPSSMKEIPDDVLNWAIVCKKTQRPFKIVKQELDFYRTMDLPMPRMHPDERHYERMAKRNPRTLWNRTCDKCGKAMQTTYAPERPETLYCEECYLAEVY